VYMYLFDNGSAKPAIIARDLDIQRPYVYVILKALQEMGFVEELSGFTSKVYGTVGINTAISNYLRREQNKIEKKTKLAEELAEAFEELRKGNLNNNAVEVFSEGARSVLAVKRLFDIAKDEILTISHPPYFSTRFHNNAGNGPENDDDPGYLTEEPDRKKLRTYRIYQIEDISLASLQLLLRTTLPEGDKIRVTKKAPAKILIVDRRFIAMGSTSPDTGLPVEDTVILHNAGLAEMLAESFFKLFVTLPEVTSLDNIEGLYEKVKNGSYNAEIDAT